MTERVKNVMQMLLMTPSDEILPTAGLMCPDGWLMSGVKEVGGGICLHPLLLCRDGEGKGRREVKSIQRERVRVDDGAPHFTDTHICSHPPHHRSYKLLQYINGISGYYHHDSRKRAFQHLHAIDV